MYVTDGFEEASDATLQDTVAPKGTPADDELPKAASLARMLSYATRTSSAALSSGDLDDAERGASILARVKRRIWRPTRSSLQVPRHCVRARRTYSCWLAVVRYSFE